jgi:transposase
MVGWRACDVMAARREFMVLARVEGANVAELCRRSGVSRKTGFKLLAQFRDEGLAASLENP